MRELAREFGLAGWRVWFEILSIADRAGDMVDCTSEGALSRLTSAAETRLRVTTDVIEWLLRRNCIATVDQLNHITRVVNYWEFHRFEERKPRPPDLTKPNLTIPNHEEKNKKPLSVAHIVFPNWLPEKEWEEFRAHRKRKRAPVTDSIAERIIGVLRQLKELGHDPAQVLTEAVDRNWTGIKVEWIDKPGGNNGKDQRHPAEPKGYAGLREFIKYRDRGSV